MKHVGLSEGVNADDGLVGVEGQPSCRLGGAEPVDSVDDIHDG